MPIHVHVQLYAESLSELYALFLSPGSAEQAVPSEVIRILLLSLPSAKCYAQGVPVDAQVLT